jgi:O-antigen ligase
VDFICFVLLNAVLYIRPAEFIPAIRGWPLYEVVLCACVVAGFPRLLEQVSPRAVFGQPISACVAVLMVATVLSNLAQGQMESAVDTADMFFKTVLYYLLLIGIVHSRDRLRWFLGAMALFAGVVMGVSVLDYHGVVHLPGMLRVVDEVWDASGELAETHRRMGSTGLFADPNDVSLLIVQNLIIAAYFLAERGVSPPARGLWGALIVLLGHALTLTHSRGGFLALLAGLVAFLMARFGRRAVPLGAVCLPVVFVLFAGRQTSLSSSEGTGQQRIQLWADYLHLFRRNPLFGIGCNNSTNYIDHVAHNSFIHGYAELGFVGGTAFLSAFCLAFWSLKRLTPTRVRILDPQLARLRPYLLAMVVCSVVGMMTLSRAYAIPTYNALGLVVAYVRLANTEPAVPPLRLDARLVAGLTGIGVLFLIVMTVYTAWAVRYI